RDRAPAHRVHGAQHRAPRRPGAAAVVDAVRREGAPADPLRGYASGRGSLRALSYRNRHTANLARSIRGSEAVLTQRTAAWRDAGRFEGIAGHRIFVRDLAGAGPPILLLHGYPSSSWDWREVAHHLPGRHLVCFDFLGFGLSDKPREHVYSLHGQADL